MFKFNKPSPALALAFVALFVALAGGAYAATAKKNSVASKSIRAGAVTTDKLADKSVTAAKLADGAIPAAGLADGSVTTAKLANAAVTTAKIDDDDVTNAKMADNSVGTSDLINDAVKTAKVEDLAVTGPKLADQSVNSTKIQNGQVRGPDLGAITVRSANDTLPTGTGAVLVVNCVGNERVISGGAAISGGLNADKAISSSLAFGNGWSAVGRNNTGADQTLNVEAYCLEG